MTSSTLASTTASSAGGRYVGAWPRIGIRPAIDGRRRGVRESLEGQTMGMARATAALLSGILRYPDGSPVECVIPEHCIGGVVEAAQAAELFRREGVGVSITVTPWCYGSRRWTWIRSPKAVWVSTAPNGQAPSISRRCWRMRRRPAGIRHLRSRRPGRGRRVDPPDVEQKLLRFARAGLAVAVMRGKSYLSLGGVSMGIAGSIVDQAFFERYLGMRVESVDMTELTRRMDEGIYDADESSARWPGRGPLPRGGRPQPERGAAEPSRRTVTGRRS